MNWFLKPKINMYCCKKLQSQGVRIKAQVLQGYTRGIYKSSDFTGIYTWIDYFEGITRKSPSTQKVRHAQGNPLIQLAQNGEALGLSAQFLGYTHCHFHHEYLKQERALIKHSFGSERNNKKELTTKLYTNQPFRYILVATNSQIKLAIFIGQRWTQISNENPLKNP